MHIDQNGRRKAKRNKDRSDLNVHAGGKIFDQLLIDGPLDLPNYVTKCASRTFYGQTAIEP